MVVDWVSALILAFVQGMAEWFPISSSGHLVITEKMLGVSGGLALEVALHFGTLMAVFVYFGKDIVNILRDIFSARWGSENGRLGLMLLFASVPAGIVGFFVKSYFDTVLSELFVVGVGFGITAMLLFISGAHHGKGFGVERLSFWRAFLIGCAQAFAILPGVSRSGSTISSGVLLGLEEKSAMKFSFLLSIPVILGASLVTLGNGPMPLSFLPATLLSFAVGICAIHFVFTRGLNKRKNFKWFGAYALLLGLALLIWELIG